MKKQFKQTTSEDALTIHVNGDVRRPEPTHLIIKFPRGHIELARCSDGSYWAHLEGDDAHTVIDSRVEYDHEGYLEHGIKPIPSQDQIKKLGVKFKGPVKDAEYY